MIAPPPTIHEYKVSASLEENKYLGLFFNSMFFLLLWIFKVSMDMIWCFIVSSKKRLDKIIPSIPKGLVMYNKKTWNNHYEWPCFYRTLCHVELVQRLKNLLLTNFHLMPNSFPKSGKSNNPFHY